MRTTVTLDQDVERMLRDESHRTRRSFKEVLNDAVRAGLRAGRKKRSRFQVRAKAMKLRAGVDPARLAELADELELEAVVGIARRGRSA